MRKLYKSVIFINIEFNRVKIYYIDSKSIFNELNFLT